METRLLTYEELGAALNITSASAKRLAIRRKWVKKPGNDGKTRVSVPIERLAVKPSPVTAITGDDAGDDTADDARDTTGDDTGDDTGGKIDAHAVVSVLSRHIERLEMQLVAVTAKLVTVESEREADRQRLEAERDTERQKASDLAAQVATIEPLKVTIEILRQALDGEKHRLRELRDERDRWHQLAAAPRGLFAWLKRSA